MKDLKEKIEKKTKKYLRMLSEPYKLLEKADKLRKRGSGDIVTFVINRNINFTNLCYCNCTFCSFSRQDKFVIGLDVIKKKVKEAIEFGCTEVCIQGGLIPGADVNFYLSILDAVRDTSDHVHIHAFSPMEIYHMARNSRLEIEDVLEKLKSRGLNSIPGTAAEILDDNIRRKICPNKISSEQWIKVVTKAHELKIPTTATMMYGHVESWKDRIRHILIIKEIQKRTKGFTEFIPLPFLWKNNELGKKVKGSCGFDDLLVIAISRVILHPVLKNIQASWVKLGIKLAQAALHAGANDFGGTLMEEHISKAAGAKNYEFLTPAEIRDVIKRCGRIPKQRDTLYNLLE